MASGAAYPNMLLHDHMAMNCYDLDQDSDIGMHAVIHLPDDYPDFYNGPVIITPKTILDILRDGEKLARETRAKFELPPKCQHTDITYEKTDTGIKLTFNFCIDDMKKVEYTEYSFKRYKTKIGKVIEKTKSKMVNTGNVYHKSEEIFLPYVNEDNPIVANILTTYETMLDRTFSEPVIINGLEDGLFDDVCNAPGIYYHPVTVNGKEITIPLIKSIFRGINKLDEFYISVNETTLPNIYLCMLQFTSKGLTEQYSAYVQYVKAAKPTE